MRPAEAWWRRPALVIGVGVALLLGGYAAISHVPPTTAEAEKGRNLGAVRQAPPAGSTATGAAVTGETTEVNPHQSPYHTQPHPYLLPGRVAFYTGLVLVLAGAVLWYRQPPSAPPDEEEPEPDPGEE